MTKERAMEIIIAHACCSFATITNKLCEKCLWNNTKDCENTSINEAIIIEAINVLKEVKNENKFD